MKKLILVVILAIVALVVPRLVAQDKEKSDGESRPHRAEKVITPLRVQVVFTEFDGDKKISSLPYTLLVNADERAAAAAVRMGVRVPIEVSTGSGAREIHYQDVGTNLDAFAERADDGRYLLRINVEKSSIYSPGAAQKPATAGGNEISTGQPIIQQFRSQINLFIRDGQTTQSTVATDPITGHVLKVDVSLNVFK